MSVSFEFRDKVVLVTGGASGIGAACARTFGWAGAKVVVADLNAEQSQPTVEAIRQAGSEATFVQVDVADPAQVERLIETTLQTFGWLDIAVNNAGVRPEASPVGEHSIENWNRIIDVNLNGVFYCMRYEIPAMLKQGGGAIVNMASIFGTVAAPDTAAYTTAKHGVIGMTKTAALESSKQGLRINAVGPGFIKTPFLGPALPRHTEAYLSRLHAVGRMGEAQEVADLVAFLCSEQASFMTGGFYPVDGGYTAQ